MKQATYGVTLTGVMPLLLHADNLTWRAAMERWNTRPENQKKSVKGDDRTPAWRWIGTVYHDGKHVGVSSDCLMTLLREGSVKVPVPGKKNLTYKRQSQSGLLVNEILWPIVTPKGLVSWDAVAKLQEEEDFAKHEEAVRDLGFELFVKSVRIGSSKHVRVRSRFNAWALSGSITVLDETITKSVLQDILDNAGRYCGLCDWRPSSPKSPGAFGTFTAELKEV